MMAQAELGIAAPIAARMPTMTKNQLRLNREELTMKTRRRRKRKRKKKKILVAAMMMMTMTRKKKRKMTMTMFSRYDLNEDEPLALVLLT